MLYNCYLLYALNCNSCCHGCCYISTILSTLLWPTNPVPSLVYLFPARIILCPDSFPVLLIEIIYFFKFEFIVTSRFNLPNNYSKRSAFRNERHFKRRNATEYLLKFISDILTLRFYISYGS